MIVNLQILVNQWKSKISNKIPFEYFKKFPHISNAHLRPARNIHIKQINIALTATTTTTNCDDDDQFAT